MAALNGEMVEIQRRKAQLEAELNNLSRAIATGPDSPTLRAAITEREVEISKLTDRTLGMKKGSVRKQMVDLRKFVKESLADVRELIAGKHARPSIVRQHISRHVDEIKLFPEGEGRAVRYKGEWKLLGSSSGAEGQS